MTKERLATRMIYELQCRICKCMAHPVRLKIVDLLDRREIAASELLAALGTPKANLSKHMASLVRAGIADQRREGRQVYYRLTHPEIHQACAIIRSILHRRLKREQEPASAITLRRRS